MNKNRDKRIEIAVWIVTSFLLIVFIPKNKIREAQVSFLFKQLLTWIFGLIVVERNLITYPTRTFFSKSNKSSFTFEYFVYPSLCALFNTHYPYHKNLGFKFLYFFLHSAGITITEAVLEKYTSLIKYNKWHWHWTFITIWLTYYTSHLYNKWFYRRN
ncbi:CBO0543 family protein [Niallia nealsonii]|uniref:Uncharacterized protein n=1 Tax=Niallia nealsonii TaxID=115979 RepID=A0A2N0Z395_9BACI|nr:CBO0543 family protein [Niallia nealsonii]PKG23991.1 hypothetical protein CWS01_09505 [Niallia nealsonii]